MNRQEYMDADFLRNVYELLLRPRLIEEKMLVLLRQGKLGKWFSGIGQEAVSVGAAMAMDTEEYLLPMHRNLGVFTTRGIPLVKLLDQFQGKITGFTQGRDRSFHFGSQQYKLIGMISHLGPQLAIACGIALAGKLAGSDQVTLVFSGEGATSEGDFHEALNLAAVWDLPVIFLIENNGYALSTPTVQQYRCESLAIKAAGYGMKGTQVDGNDVLAVYNTIRKARAHCREQQAPYLVECITFRMRGHEEASGIKYVPPSLLKEWSKKDPIARLEAFLARENILSSREAGAIKHRLEKEINSAVAAAFQAVPPDAVSKHAVSADAELQAMYARPETGRPAKDASEPVSSRTTKVRFIDAISDALRRAMREDSKLLIMGQDIADYGGVFKITEGFLDEFGPERVRNTPICESAIIGAAYGLAIAGYPSVVEIQFADFITMGFNQVVNNLAKSHYRWGQPAGVVIRMPTGAGTASGPFHSQSTEAWFTKTPGLKVVYPAFPSDARSLLLAAIEDPDPVLFFEHKYLYRKLSEDLPDTYHPAPIGQAQLRKEGTAVSIITYGLGVHWAMEVLELHPEISADLLDLRSLSPWDKTAVAATVKKTGKVLILHEDTLTGGFGGEIAAWIAEHCFRHLDAPVRRCCSLDTAVPTNPWLETRFLARYRLENKLLELLAY